MYFTYAITQKTNLFTKSIAKGPLLNIANVTNTTNIVSRRQSEIRYHNAANIRASSF